ncbi:sugar phosphate isomerase/epimerase family protein [Portibacter marinus]|uniref:sugar phosphate isomerase/epimerase family protein n=1 Tax=Portibacter marinus TaxID=2898660 RepID=UPI001F47A601|nr:TIM barrel protein [Portibacter marinus]
MKRRTFIENTGLISAATFLGLPYIDLKKSSTYKLGYQLYSIRDKMATNPIDTIKALKGFGYEDFEVYGYDNKSNTIYGFKPSEFKSILSDLELTISSGHYAFAPYLEASASELKKLVDQYIVAAKELESRYITWPFMAPEQRSLETYKKLPELLNRIGERVKAAGLEFAYHNHGFEFEDHEGENAFDILIRHTDPELVKLQMDMYWVMHAGTTTPKKLVDEQPGRYVMWHIKDMDAASRDYTELGNGSINYHNVLPDPQKSGLEFYYIEQGGNYAKDSLKSAAFSAKYFIDQLQHKL